MSNVFWFFCYMWLPLFCVLAVLFSDKVTDPVKWFFQSVVAALILDTAICSLILAIKALFHA